MRRALRITAWTLASIAALVVLAVVAVFIAGNTAPGRSMIERITFQLTAGMVKLAGLGGSLPSSLTLERLELHDHDGVWLSADRIALSWSPLQLLDGRIAVDDLHAARVDMERLPVPNGPPSPQPVKVPHIEIARFSIDAVQLGAALVGRPATLSLKGGGGMRSLMDASADLEARRIDPGGDGEYTVHFKLDRARMDGTLVMHEPASGPLENILGLPGLGALSANLGISGPRNGERIVLDVRAGGATAKVAGTVNLATGAADLDYSIDAPEVSPRPDLKWRRVSLKGDWHGPFSSPVASGRLEVDRLELPGSLAVGGVRADLHARGGTVGVTGELDGLRIPGPDPSLLERDALKIDASMRLSEASHPLHVSAVHPLLALEADAVTAGAQRATLDLKLPNVAPLASMAGQDVRGTADVKARVERRSSDIALTLGIDATVSGGAARWIDITGRRLALELAGAVSDDAFTVERLKLTAGALRFSASGSAVRAPPASGAVTAGGAATAGVGGLIKDLKARWDLGVSDLHAAAPMLAGTLEASGTIGGAPTALAADADMKTTVSIRGSPPGTLSATLRARGLPSAPSASIQVRGMLDGSPIDLAGSLARAGRTGLTARVERGEWKSVHLDGSWAMQSSVADSRGAVHVKVGQLADFNDLSGADLHGGLVGNVDLTPQGGETRARFDVKGEGLGVGRYSGTLHFSGEGSTSGVVAQLQLSTPDLEGYPAALSAGATVNLDAHALEVHDATATYHKLEVKLLTPARASYANGFAIEELKLGMQGAVLEVGGQLSPTLDMHASLSHVGPQTINAIVPDLVSSGTVEASLRLRGTPSDPEGRVSLAARGFHFASDEALGLPPLDLSAGAELAGEAATVDVRFTAGTAPLLRATGRVPFNPDGTYDLKIEGKMDLDVANSILGARGLRADGKLGVDASISGRRADPNIQGAITLADGDFRDYAHGFNLTGINAEVDGSEGALKIKSFNARAASGTVGLSGSVGVLQPHMPVDLKLTAVKAQAISSQVLTANLNADITVRGTAEEHLDVAGTIDVNRAVIGIPDSLPPDVAVLDVRRRGQQAQAAAKRLTVGLDITIRAPREVLVQGRGLDAEMGDSGGGRSLRIRGTTAAPVVSGELQLIRGTFTLGSTLLTFDNSSKVSFDGTGLKKNIDPTLDFTASSTVQGITAKLTISGYADSPKFDLSSPSGQSQDEIMALLLFGEPAAQLTALQAAQAAAALATLSGIGGSGGNPLTRLQKTLGLDRLSVASSTTTSVTGATESQGAAIQAGRYITRRVYIEGKQSTTGQSQVEVDVDLTRHLKLQTRLGNGTAIQGTTPENDPGSSVGLSYQFEY
jgi:translocation and assembly module TamB